MTKKQLTLFVAALLAGSALGYGVAILTSPEMTPETMPETAPEKSRNEKEILYWVAPMDPNFRSDRPGKSPMGMDLIPVYAEDAAADASREPALKINPAVVNNLGVRTATVERSSLHYPVRTVGYVTPDDNRISLIDLRVEGWIEKLYVKAENEWVRKGDPLFKIYSPQLVTAQTEYLQALKRDNAFLIKASEDRLRALGLRDGQIRALREKRRVENLTDIQAPQDGVILTLNVREGMFIKPGDTIFTLADLSSVWVMAEIFEQQLPWIARGQAADMVVAATPEKRWKGEVDYVYPVVDPVSRTVKLRLRFDNPDGLLKPNMYSTINIRGQARNNVLHIPREALIRTGTSERVILALGDGKFRPAKVVAGVETADRVEVLEGLHEGERVVTSAQFLLDSEASLDAGLMRLDATPHKADDAITNNHADHGDMDHSDMNHSDMDHAGQETDHD